jgi:AhpD family alkylhydroperoxidase
MNASGRLLDGSLDPRTRELIALGAAVGGNCRLSFDRHYNEAIHRGIPLARVEAAIEIARTVRSVSDQEMDSQILCRLAATNAELSNATDGGGDSGARGAIREQESAEKLKV